MTCARSLALLFLLTTFTVSVGHSQKIVRTGLIFSFQVKTNVQTDTFPALLTNKEWDKGQPISLESNSNFGRTLTSGVRRGWSIFLQPNGALGWNIGDEKNRLDYLPTGKRRINDGRWHQIDCFYDTTQSVMWLWLDGQHLTTYNYKNLDLTAQQIEQDVRELSGKEIRIRRFRPKTSFSPTVDYPSLSTEPIRVVNWNIWHGGRHNGARKGVEEVIGHLRGQYPDIICLQETYGSGPAIADSLGFTFYYISTNLSILSHLPFAEVYNGWDSFRYGGARLSVSDTQSIAVFDIWLNSSPSTDRMLREKMPLGTFMAQEMKTRGREMLLAHEAIRVLGLPDQLPRLVAGDFNSASHLDWTTRTAWRYNGMAVPWPASRTMAREGYIDVWRTLHPDETRERGVTWSPRFKDELQYRIDYIYADSQYWIPLESAILGYQEGMRWPSDHCMVTAVLQLTSPKTSNLRP